MSEIGESAQRRSEPRPRRPGWTLLAIIGATCAAIPLALGVKALAESEQNKKPEFLLQGGVPNTDAELRGAVNLKCIRLGRNVVVNGEVRLVTDREDGNATRGRIVRTHTRIPDANCADSLETMRANPQEIIDQVVDNVGGIAPKIAGDGTFGAAKKYLEVFERAEEENVRVFVTD